MTEPFAYERDPFLRSLETDVVTVGVERGQAFVVLADTILFPEGGGQPADRGGIGGVRVEDVRTVEGQVRHYLAGPPPIGRVRVELDWARRFDHMQQHTGQHLLTAVAEQRLGWHTTAFHLGDRLADIELDTAQIAPAQLAELEEAIAAEVRACRSVTARRVTPEEYAALPVRTRGLPEGHAGDIRLVEIAGLDLNTCGGTHVRSTAEVEALKLLGIEGMRGGTRLFYVAGGRLRQLLGAHHERNARLRQLVGTSDEEMAAGVSAKLEQLKEAQRSIRALEEELGGTVAGALAARPGRLVDGHWPGRDLSFLQRIAKEVVRLAPDKCVFLTAGEGEQGVFVLSTGEQVQVDLVAAGRTVAEILGGRGGGGGRVFQGKVATLSRRDQALGYLSALP